MEPASENVISPATTYPTSEAVSVGATSSVMINSMVGRFMATILRIGASGINKTFCFSRGNGRV